MGRRCRLLGYRERSAGPLTGGGQTVSCLSLGPPGIRACVVPTQAPLPPPPPPGPTPAPRGLPSAPGSPPHRRGAGQRVWRVEDVPEVDGEGAGGRGQVQGGGRGVVRPQVVHAHAGAVVGADAEEGAVPARHTCSTRACVGWRRRSSGSGDTGVRVPGWRCASMWVGTPDASSPTAPAGQPISAAINTPKGRDPNVSLVDL